ncbi:hypothetical protein O3S80_03875 [Streptomyces sp. Lzd4kr]|nr:hypothetical protein [Streptomyces sp. Lzd4kr]
MSVLIQASQLRLINLGQLVSKASGAFAADTRSLFTVTGGEVLITALYGKVTTAITVANTVKLQTNPTTGDTADLTTATDIGTTDTAVGTILGVLDQTDTPPDLNRGGKALGGVVVSTGDIEQVTTGTGPDGAVTWYATWVPLTDGATLAAA